MTRSILIAVLAIALFGIALAAPWDAGSDLHARGDKTFSTCPGVPNIQTIDSVFISPDQPGQGQLVTITVNAHTPQAIPADAWMYAQSTGSPDLIPWTICAAAKKAFPATPCPIPAGPYTFQYSVTLAEGIPVDQTTIQTFGIEVTETLFCFNFSP
ncbi:hypothetical protein BJ322DRAFT_1156515 [Thelephora terrestris]|uniref:Phosphatidylglycerol/phosphatidylinositol transfer protein n=1 Tax=Thelephora terrestris TaxID=56493 RepID=A0A9P6L5E8_9AGAM|nr:hypothetical protein BJ322DRAFT_1156515 [Thelephora terrestris]